MTDKAPAKKTAAKKAPAATAESAEEKTTAKKASATKAAAKEPRETAVPDTVAEPATEAPERFQSDDPKEMFRYALEQKKRKSGFGSEAHLTGGSPAHGKSAKAGGKREFRRKSG